MKTVTIDVRPLTDAQGDFTQAWKSKNAFAPRISFESPELLFKVLSGKRRELLYGIFRRPKTKSRIAPALCTYPTNCVSWPWPGHNHLRREDQRPISTL
jgi:hypothetical protein